MKFFFGGRQNKNIRWPRYFGSVWISPRECGAWKSAALCFFYDVVGENYQKEKTRRLYQNHSSQSFCSKAGNWPRETGFGITGYALFFGSGNPNTVQSRYKNGGGHHRCILVHRPSWSLQAGRGFFYTITKTALLSRLRFRSKFKDFYPRFVWTVLLELRRLFHPQYYRLWISSCLGLTERRTFPRFEDSHRH